MIKRKHILLPIILTATLLIAACGGNGGGNGGAGGNGGNNGGDNQSVSTENSTNSNSGGSDAFANAVNSVAGENSDGGNGGSGSGGAGVSYKQGDEKVEVQFYKVSDDMGVVYITGKPCADLISKSLDEDGDYYFQIKFSEDENIQLRTYGGYYTLPGNGFGASSYYRDCFAGSNSYIAKFTEDGAGNAIGAIDPNRNMQVLLCPKYGSMSDYVVVYEGKAGEVKDLTKEDYEVLENSVYAQGVAANPVQADWSGTYIVDYSYEGEYGSIKCDITEGGLLHLSVNFKDFKKDLYCEEKDFDKADYAYGTYITAGLESYNMTRNSNLEVKYKVEPDAEPVLEFTVGGYLTEGSDYVSIRNTLKKFMPWHVAPADYEDKDLDGYIAALDLTDEKIKPVTDDYVIYFQDKIGDWNGEGYDYHCRYTISSFDVNGILVKETTKDVYETEAQAKAYYDKESKYYENMSLSGNAVYDIKEQSMYSCVDKLDSIYYAVYSNWYKNCHYCYESSYGEEWGHKYCYISKPITDDDFNVDAEAAVYWKPIGSTSHRFRSKDVQGTSFGGDVNKSDSLRLFVWGTYPDEYLRSYHTDGYIKFRGMSAVACTYASEYAKSGNDVLNYVVFTEYTFGSEETVISEYVFKVENFDNVEITFDNFKTKTPDYTWTQHFDMTREAD